MFIKPKNKVCISCGRDDMPWFSHKRCKPCSVAESVKEYNDSVKSSFVPVKKELSDKVILGIEADEAFYLLVWSSFPHFCMECDAHL